MKKDQPDTISDTEVLQAPELTESVFTPTTETLVSKKAVNRIFILSNDKRQGKVILDVEEDVIDPKTGRQRRMRLLRGANTIWFDEQPPSVFPKEYVAKNVECLEFDKGICIIPINKPMHLQAAELTMRNQSNQKKYKDQARPKDIYFYEWNPVELNQVAIAEENDVIKAMQLAMTTPIAEVIPHAKYLNIEFQDEMGVELDESALRNAYIRYAKNNAKKFLVSIQSPTVKVAHMVRRGINEGKIDLGKQPGAAYWVDGGFISALPEGRDAVEYLIEFAQLHGEDNANFSKQLRTFFG